MCQCIGILLPEKNAYHLQHSVGNHGNNTIEEFVLKKAATGIYFEV